jgi:hypothetical protein
VAPAPHEPRSILRRRLRAGFTLVPAAAIAAVINAECSQRATVDRDRVIEFAMPARACHRARVLLT